MSKVMVLGIDGAPFTLLETYLQKGVLPNLARILKAGHGLSQMDAPVPDVSSTSWASFFTGTNPAEHGIFGFMELKPGTYSMRFPSYEDVRTPAVWEIAGGTSGMRDSGLKAAFAGAFASPAGSVVLNIPQTYPARPMNGVLTAGFVCPDLKKGTYPAAAYDYLSSMGYMSDVDSNKAVEDSAAFFKEVALSLEKRAKAYEHFLEKGGWELFIGVVTETDRVHHFFYDAAFDASHAFNGEFLAVYDRLDRLVGSLYDRFMDLTGGQGKFMTMSDHGFTAIKTEVYLNAWLRENGWLTLDSGKEYYEQVALGSRAFCMDPSRIYLNVRGKYPRGSVDPSQRASVASELKDALKAISGPDGSKVMKEVYLKEDIYRGRLMDEAPDLVCVANDGYDLKGNLKKSEVFGRSAFRGMHTRHDAHCIMPLGMMTSGRLHIEKLAPLILESLAGADTATR
ncbi:hypothetical protein BAC1_00279 [uncultured bacterium]|nr:hypothetical protein BAC1_00279 [uncultured bacterium]